MEKTYLQVLRDLSLLKFSRCYLVTGNTDFEALRFLAIKIANALQKRDTLEALEILYHDSTKTSLREALRDAQGDLFADRNVVVFRGFDVLTAQAKAQAVEEAETELTLLIDKAFEGPLILATTAEKLDGRKKWSKRLADDPAITIVPTHVWKSEDLLVLMDEWLTNTHSLTKEQKLWVIQRSRLQFGAVYQNVQKINTFLLSDNGMNEEILLQLIADEAQEDLFAVVKSFIEGEREKAYSQYLRLHQESVFALIALLLRQYRLIARVSEPDARRKTDQELASMLSVHPYACKVARQQARNLSIHACQKAMIDLTELEHKIKTGQITERYAIDWWFFKGDAK